MPESECTIATSENPPGTPLISVIVPVKKTYLHVGPTLDLLLGQEISEPFEILVCTEENSDVARLVADKYPMVRLVLGKADRGPGGNRNHGIEEARGEYLAFIDADCIPEPDWLTRLVQAVRENNGRPVRGWTEVFPRSSRIVRAAQIAQNGTGEPRKARVVPGLTGGNMGVSRSLLSRTGARFAEDVYGAEEIVLLSRLPKTDLLVVLDPKIRVKEEGADRLRDSLRRSYRLGVGSGQLRRALPLRGALFGRHKLAVPLLVPGRFLLIAGRLPWCTFRTAMDVVMLSPLVLLHLCWYAAGFSRGIRGKRGTSIGPENQGMSCVCGTGGRTDLPVTAENAADVP